jgi:hypothetical protein
MISSYTNLFIKTHKYGFYTGMLSGFSYSVYNITKGVNSSYDPVSSVFLCLISPYLVLGSTCVCATIGATYYISIPLILLDKLKKS